MIEYFGDNLTILKAVSITNDILLMNNFHMDIENHKPFDNCDVTNRKIASILISSRNYGEVIVVIYRPWWRWSKAVAYFSKKKPNQININRYKIPHRSINDYIETLVHEYVHLIDNKYLQFDFGHGDNSSNGKQNTAPYSIGRIARKLADRYYS